MKKRIKLAGAINRKEHGGEPSFDVSLPNESIRDWCLGLALLKEDLAESIIIVPSTGKLTLHVRVEHSAARGDITAFLDDDAIHLNLSEVTLDYIFSFSLKHYRDGYAEVDHIDLQTVFKDLGDNIYVTLSFEKTGKPVDA